MHRFALLLVTFALLGLVGACDTRKPVSREDNVAVAWERVVRNAHNLADHATSESQRERAVEALRGALRAAPHPVNGRLQWVVQDLNFPFGPSACRH